MDFQTAVRTVLSKYVDFKGRAPRSEYWWWVLAVIVVNIILNIIDNIIFGPTMQPISALFSLAILLPSIAVGIRRLHDLDRTGWWLLVSFIPIIGALILIYFFVQKGTDGENRFGPDPLA